MVEQAEDELTLRQLVEKALADAEVATGPTAPADAKQLQADSCSRILVSSALSQLALCASLILHLSVLSPNETIDDLTAASLRCILVPALQGECELQLRALTHAERNSALGRAQSHFKRFIGQVDDYEIVPPDQKKVATRAATSSLGPAQRREAKIAQYKAERELKERVDALKRQKGRTGVNAAVEDNDAVARNLTLAEIRLRYVQSHAQLYAIDQEIELLSSMPPPVNAVPESKKGEEDLSWKVDRNGTSLPTSGPILSSQGRVLRPFTILPSESRMDARIRLQSQVFGPGYRLPTMTIDEYLDQEAARGNILTGGGEEGAARQDAEKEANIALREGDNLAAEQLGEVERRKEMEWDSFKDDHRRGEGNRLNRG